MNLSSGKNLPDIYRSMSAHTVWADKKATFDEKRMQYVQQQM